MNLRSLISGLSIRARLNAIMGHTYKGARHVSRALGYKDILGIEDYRWRFERNGIANRVVKALPNATWRGGAEIWEDQDPNIDTPFEVAFEQFNRRLKFWDTMRRADVLARIGRYSVVLIGGPGEMDQPLERASLDELAYLQPYGEDDAKIQDFERDNKNPRFGLPTFYLINRVAMSHIQSIRASEARRVHYTRCFHLANDLLDDRLFGEPALKCVWNWLDDLDKVAGGGSEAFWRRADQGTMFNVDDEVPVDETERVAFEQQLKDYEHKLKRYILARGVTATPLGSDVADFNSPVMSLIGLISAATGIPQRVLMGSEQGKLAARQDRGNWDDRVSDRRVQFADPLVVRPFIEMLVGFGALPKPVDDYEVRFPELKILDDEQRAQVATEWANLKQGVNQEPVVSRDEIRTRVLGLEPWDDVNSDIPPQPMPNAGGPRALSGKEGLSHLHATADRFRSTDARRRRESVLRRQANRHA